MNNVCSNQFRLKNLSVKVKSQNKQNLKQKSESKIFLKVLSTNAFFTFSFINVCFFKNFALKKKLKISIIDSPLDEMEMSIIMAHKPMKMAFCIGSDVTVLFKSWKIHDAWDKI